MAKANLLVAACILLMFVSTAIHISEGRHLNFRERKDAHADSFRPTDPGHSPGAGHSLQLQISSAQMVKDASTSHARSSTYKSVDSDHQVVPEPEAPSPVVTLTQPPPTKGVDDFQPTNPGHSPGAGH